LSFPVTITGRFLGDCVASILTQKGVDLRVLVIDNASKDDSLAIARSLAAQDRRVEVLAHVTNKGAAFSYNEGTVARSWNVRAAPSPQWRRD
jgi:glycosyltransferase involved in cell wall biosynthesis